MIIGGLVVAVYLVALAFTVGLRNDHVRPLYDGFAPPPSYRWVEPPAFFASGNVTPTSVSTTIPLGHDGSAATGIATPDGQFVLNLGRGAIPARSGASKVTVKITPVAPSTLGPVPDGLRANGNAYRVEMTYPGGASVERLAQPGTLVVEIPELGADLYSSRRGTGWSKTPARTLPPRQLSLTAPFAMPGYYVGATNLPELVAPATSSSDHSIAIGIGVAALAAIGFVVAFLIVRRRRRQTDP